MSVVDRFPRYREGLALVALMDEAALVALVAQLPDEIRAKLAAGPLPYRYDCGVCQAFGEDLWRNDDAVDTEDPKWVVWAYHEVPKLRMRVSAELHIGPLSDEGYERALATYRAAGWGG